MASGFPPFSDTRMTPPATCPKIIVPSCPQLNPYGFVAGQIVTGAPPVIATLLIKPPPPPPVLAIQKATDRLSGENDGLSTPPSIPGIALDSSSDIERRCSCPLAT